MIKALFKVGQLYLISPAIATIGGRLLLQKMRLRRCRRPA